MWKERESIRFSKKLKTSVCGAEYAVFWRYDSISIYKIWHSFDSVNPNWCWIFLHWPNKIRVFLCWILLHLIFYIKPLDKMFNKFQVKGHGDSEKKKAAAQCSDSKLAAGQLISLWHNIQWYRLLNGCKSRTVLAISICMLIKYSLLCLHQLTDLTDFAHIDWSQCNTYNHPLRF